MPQGLQPTIDQLESSLSNLSDTADSLLDKLVAIDNRIGGSPGSSSNPSLGGTYTPTGALRIEIDEGSSFAERAGSIGLGGILAGPLYPIAPYLGAGGLLASGLGDEVIDLGLRFAGGVVRGTIDNSDDIASAIVVGTIREIYNITGTVGDIAREGLADLGVNVEPSGPLFFRDENVPPPNIFQRLYRQARDDVGTPGFFRRLSDLTRRRERGESNEFFGLSAGEAGRLGLETLLLRNPIGAGIGTFLGATPLASGSLPAEASGLPGVFSPVRSFVNTTARRLANNRQSTLLYRRSQAIQNAYARELQQFTLHPDFLNSRTVTSLHRTYARGGLPDAALFGRGPVPAGLPNPLPLAELSRDRTLYRGIAAPSHDRLEGLSVGDVFTPDRPLYTTFNLFDVLTRYSQQESVVGRSRFSPSLLQIRAARGTPFQIRQSRNQEIVFRPEERFRLDQIVTGGEEATGIIGIDNLFRFTNVGLRGLTGVGVAGGLTAGFGAFGGTEAQALESGGFGGGGYRVGSARDTTAPVAPSLGSSIRRAISLGPQAGVNRGAGIISRFSPGSLAGIYTDIGRTGGTLRGVGEAFPQLRGATNAGYGQLATYQRSLGEAIDELPFGERVREQAIIAEDSLDGLEEASDFFGRNLADALGATVRQTDDWADRLRNIPALLQDIILELAIVQPATNILSDLFSSFAGGLFRGSSLGDLGSTDLIVDQTINSSNPARAREYTGQAIEAARGYGIG